MEPGSFVVSLDFELYWGVRDGVTLDAYRERLLGERAVIPKMLALFEAYRIHATWATVGFLFAQDRADIEKCMPRALPTYEDRSLSPYEHLRTIGKDEREDPFHYAPTLLELIAAAPGQEVGTHTFSHYYCLEPGQTASQFEADLEAAARIGKRFGNICKSLVFPRNQYNPAYMDVLERAGVAAYRSNGSHWAYRARAGARDLASRRLARLVDTYVPLSGSGAKESRVDDMPGPVDIPASAFLRPFAPSLKHLLRLQHERLAFGMTRAASTGRIFHLWWHPHNFGRYSQENLDLLEALLKRFDRLRERTGFASRNMSEAAAWVKAGVAI